MSFKIAGAGEAVLKKLGDEVLIFRDSNQAVAHVTGRQHAQLTAQAPAGTAIIAHGDKGGEVRDEDAVWRGIAGANGVLLEAFKQSGEAGAAANGDNTNPPG